MSLQTQFAGKPITAEEAQNYMAKQLELKKCLKDEVLSEITLGQIKASPTMKDTNTFFDSDVNAFIFERDLVTRFFPTDGSPVADYLMVVIGAKYKNDAECGNPTIVVAGVKQQGADSKGKPIYVSLKIKDPATEQPGLVVYPKFISPQIVGDEQIEFTIL